MRHVRQVVCSHASRRGKRRVGSNARGAFTLIEAIGTIVILAVLGTLASTIILTASDGYLTARTTAGLHHEGSLAIERIVRELRHIARDPDAEGIAADINEVTSQSIRWQDDNRVYLDQDRLLIVIDGAAPRVLTDRVQAFTIAAADEADEPITLPVADDACDPIRRITITLTLHEHEASESLRTRVFLRAAAYGEAAP